MIKINLAKMSSGGGGVNVASAVSSGGPGQPAPNFVKILLIIVIPLGLYIYQDLLVSEKIVARDKTQKELDKIKTEIGKLGALTAVVQSLADEKLRLQKQLTVIGKISSKRAFKLRTISEVQKSLPDDCWLEEVLISKEGVSFKGYARLPSSVQNLVEGLDSLDFLDSAYNKELKRVKLGSANVHQFNVVAEVNSNGR